MKQAKQPTSEQIIATANEHLRNLIAISKESFAAKGCSCQTCLDVLRISTELEEAIENWEKEVKSE